MGAAATAVVAVASLTAACQTQVTLVSLACTRTAGTSATDGTRISGNRPMIATAAADGVRHALYAGRIVTVPSDGFQKSKCDAQVMYDTSKTVCVTKHATVLAGTLEHVTLASAAGGSYTGPRVTIGVTRETYVTAKKGGSSYVLPDGESCK